MLHMFIPPSRLQFSCLTTSSSSFVFPPLRSGAGFTDDPRQAMGYQNTGDWRIIGTDNGVYMHPRLRAPILLENQNGFLFLSVLLCFSIRPEACSTIGLLRLGSGSALVSRCVLKNKRPTVSTRIYKPLLTTPGCFNTKSRFLLKKMADLNSSVFGCVVVVNG